MFLRDRNKLSRSYTSLVEVWTNNSTPASADLYRFNVPVRFVEANAEGLDMSKELQLMQPNEILHPYFEQSVAHVLGL